MEVKAAIEIIKAALAQGNLRQAIADCTQALQISPHADLYRLLGKALSATGEVTAAKVAYQDWVELQPDCAEAWAGLGQLCSQQDDWVGATRHYRQAIASAPNWAALHYNLGVVLHQQNDWAGAARHYQQAIALSPPLSSQNAQTHFNLGIVRDQQGQLAAAADHYQEAIALQPQYLEAFSNLGCVRVKQFRLEEAIQVYQQALRLRNSDNPASATHWATLYNNLGQAQAAQGNPAEAIAAYQEAIHLQPDMALAHHNLGIVWLQQGQYATAEACFHRAIELNPKNIPAYGDWGNALLAQGKLEQAMAAFRQSIAPYADWIEAYCDWAAGLTGSDHLTQARITCSRVLRALQQADFAEICPDLAQTCLHLGNALIEYGSTTQAEAYYQRALQLHPQMLEPYLRLAGCLQQQQRSTAAILVCHLALARHPHHAQIRFQLGALLEQQQQFEAAIDYYRQVWQQGGTGIADQQAIHLLTLPQKQPPQGIYRTTWEWAQAAGKGDRSYINLTQKDDQATGKPSAIAPPDPQLPETCGGLSCAPCLQKIFSQFDLTYAQDCIHVSCDKLRVEELPRFVAILPDGRAWAVPQQNGWQVCRAIAILTVDNFLLADLSRDYPGQLPGCQVHRPDQHRVFSMELPPVEAIAGTVAVLAGLSGNVYFHWMVDVLPRLELLHQSGITLESIDWFLVNSSQAPFQRETLQALGIPLAKILEGDRHPHIQATQLIVPSFAGYLGWLQPWALAFLRQTFLPLIQPPGSKTSSGDRRLYICRSHADHRRVLNEAAVIEQLRQRGFKAVVLESLPFLEQVALFAHAETIVAAHGSGLTNLLFCQPETQVIELVSPHYIAHYYWVISQQLGLVHRVLVGEKFECHSLRQLMYQNPLTEDIWVNLPALITLLNELNVTVQSIYQEAC